MQRFFKTTSQGIAAATLVVSVFALLAVLQLSMLSRNYVDPNGIDLAGAWHIRSLDRKDKYIVEVPEPIPDAVLARLGDEFIYSKKFKIPHNLLRSGESLSLSLGSVKGDHEIYWNGKFLGSGQGVSLALYKVPEQFLEESPVELEVRIQKMNTAFPGIVHAKPLPLGRSSYLERQLLDYYFQTGIKPLIPAVFKAIAMVLFLGVCAFVPNRTEYFSFAAFSFFTSVSSILNSRFTPGYDQFHFKQGMIFLFFALSLSVIPLMTASFLRFGKEARSYARIYGASVAMIAILSALFCNDESSRFAVYRAFHLWGATLVFAPAFILALAHGFKLRQLAHLGSRTNQVFAYSACMLIALFAWTAHSRNFLRFDQILAPELMDVGVYAALAFALLSDFRFAAMRSERVGRAVPKWFKAMLSTSRVTNVKLEISMLALAVDTVSYTKNLSTKNEVGKEKIHADIRAALVPLTQRYGAEKLSDRGDGALFGWDLPESGPEREEVVQKVLFACKALSRGAGDGLMFRIGLAAGIVRGEWRGGDFSFMGDALNAAARLETMAQPGTALVHESLVADLEPHLSSGWKEAEIKGLLYRGKPISRAC